MNNLKRATAVAIARVFTFMATPGATASEPAITANAAREPLPPAERSKRDLLTEAEQSESIRILADEDFGTPGRESAAQNQWDHVEVTEEDGTTYTSGPTLSPEASAAQSAAVASTSRSHWYEQSWKILGITSTKIRTTIGWTANGFNVTSVDRCYGTNENYAPFRSIDKASWFESTATTATCRTDRSLDRPLQSTVTGVHGLRASRDGVLLLTWEV